MLDNIDKKIIALMQGNFPLVAKPYCELAKMAGITEPELLQRLNNYQKSGRLRKMGAVLKHRAIGYVANALCAWIVEDKRLDEVAKIMTAEAAVTHCYSRINAPGWPYNFYTMIHARSKEECDAIALKLSSLSDVNKYTMLYSTKEWKKASMQYFPEHQIKL